MIKIYCKCMSITQWVINCLRVCLSTNSTKSAIQLISQISTLLLIARTEYNLCKFIIVFETYQVYQLLPVFFPTRKYNFVQIMVFVCIFGRIVGRNTQEFILVKRRFLTDLFAQLHVNSDTPLRCRENVMDKVEFNALVTQSLYTAQHIAQLIDVHRQLQKLSQIFHLAQQKTSKYSHHFPVEIVHILKLEFTVQGRRLTKFLLFSFVLIEILLVLIQLWDILTRELAYWIIAISYDKLFLNIFEGQSTYFCHELLELLKEQLPNHITQMQMVRPLYLILWSTLLYQTYGQCGNTITANLTADTAKFAGAGAVTLEEERTIIEIYKNMTFIADYVIAIETNGLMYTNIDCLCQGYQPYLYNFTALNDVWLCFDEFQMLECNPQWSLLVKCGTFIEFHKPFNPEILIQMDLGSAEWTRDINGVNMINVTVKGLCAGLYHIWFVYYSRQGKYVKRVKTIYINYPGCQC